MSKEKLPDGFLPVRYHFPEKLPQESWRAFQRDRAAEACDSLNARLLQIGNSLPAPGSNDPDEVKREIYRSNLEAVVDFLFEAGFPVQAAQNLRELHAELQDVSNGASPSIFQALKRRGSKGGRSPVPAAIASRRTIVAAALTIAHEDGAPLPMASKRIAKQLRPFPSALFGSAERVSSQQILRWRDENRTAPETSERGAAYRELLAAVANGLPAEERIKRLIHVAVGGLGVEVRSL